MSLPYNITETALVKMGQGKLKKVIINSHTSGTLKLVDGLSNGAVATTVLTSSGAMVPADYAIGTLTSTGTNVNDAAAAVGTLTSDNTNVSNGDTVTIDTKVYTFKTTLTTSSATDIEGEVLIGADADASLLNLIRAINHTGTYGTDYKCSAPHPTVSAATSVTAHAFVITARTTGTGGNSIATTETSAHLSWGGATLASGAAADTVVVGATGGTPITYTFKTTPINAYDVKIGADAATTLANLKKAINGTGTAGVEYANGTVVNPDIIAYTITSTTLKVGFRTIGATGNSYTTTETSAQLSWGGATLAGGVTTAGATFTLDTTTYTATLTLADTLGLSVANQVLWVTSEAVFLDNVKSAINRTGTPGTDYSAATTIHPTVFATTNTNTQQTFNAKYPGTAGNSIATTETIANYAFTGSTMASGTLTTSKTICNTITFSAVATTGERIIDFGDDGIDFATGLLAVVGGTADLTLLIDNQ